jgi:hypothetical protein
MHQKKYNNKAFSFLYSTIGELDISNCELILSNYELATSF